MTHVERICLGLYALYVVKVIALAYLNSGS